MMLSTTAEKKRFSLYNRRTGLFMHDDSANLSPLQRTIVSTFKEGITGFQALVSKVLGIDLKLCRPRHAHESGDLICIIVNNIFL